MSIRIIQNLLENPKDFVILDTETSGKENDDFVIEISIINGFGKTLLNEKVKPINNKAISKEAFAIHGITKKDLEKALYLEELKTRIEDCIRDKTVVIYNAPFDQMMLHRSAKINNFNFFSLNTLPLQYVCLMRLYAKYVGEINKFKTGYKWQKLPGGDHSSLGDCKAVLMLMKKIANNF